MSGTQTFVCYPCGQTWEDKYTLWQGYLSVCPVCGKGCQALCDTQEFADQREWKGFYDAPLFDFDGEHLGKAEDDLEAERDLIHDEIAEALGAVEADESDDDAEADSDAAGGGEGF